MQFFGMEHEGRVVGNRVEDHTSNMDFYCGSKLEKLLYPIKTIYSVEAGKKIRQVPDDFQMAPSIIPEICI